MSDRRTVHFDHFSEEYAADPWAIFRELRDQCPVAWSETYGGFWVLSKYEDVKAVAFDDEAFSSAQSVTVPAKPPGSRLSIPIEVDPPLFLEYRRLLNPWFSPARAERMEPTIRAFVTELIDRFIERGRCDLVHDFTNPLTAMSTLSLLGLDPAEWETYAVPVHGKTFLLPAKTKQPEFAQSYEQLHKRVMGEILARREAPRDDLISALVTAQIAGRPLTPDEIQDIIMLIIHGGFDTTGSGISNAMLYLDEHHQARDRLREDPALLPLAVEEFLRYQAPQPGLARVATRECVIRDQKIGAGDRLLLLWASANRDEDVFDRADEIVLDRFPNRHVTFGTGAHRCLGAPLASVEMRVALEEVLARLPDFSIDRKGIVQAETVGTVYGHFSIPMAFTPGSRSG
jgi:cytochrome P450